MQQNLAPKIMLEAKHNIGIKNPKTHPQPII